MRFAGVRRALTKVGRLLIKHVSSIKCSTLTG
jgi:hypothetical protein